MPTPLGVTITTTFEHWRCDRCKIKWDSRAYADDCERHHAALDAFMVGDRVMYMNPEGRGGYKGVIIRISHDRWRGGALVETYDGTLAGERHWVWGGYMEKLP